ncbi:AgrD family cyclic lactone autoinducer peptide [Microcoleus sp. Pol12B5]
MASASRVLVEISANSKSWFFY